MPAPCLSHCAAGLRFLLSSRGAAVLSWPWKEHLIPRQRPCTPTPAGTRKETQSQGVCHTGRTVSAPDWHFPGIRLGRFKKYYSFKVESESEGKKYLSHWVCGHSAFGTGVSKCTLEDPPTTCSVSRMTDDGQRAVLPHVPPISSSNCLHCLLSPVFN